MEVFVSKELFSSDHTTTKRGGSRVYTRVFFNKKKIKKIPYRWYKRCYRSAANTSAFKKTKSAANTRGQTAASCSAIKNLKARQIAALLNAAISSAQGF